MIWIRSYPSGIRTDIVVHIVVLCSFSKVLWNHALVASGLLRYPFLLGGPLLRTFRGSPHWDNRILFPHGAPVLDALTLDALTLDALTLDALTFDALAPPGSPRGLRTSWGARSSGGLRRPRDLWRLRRPHLKRDVLQLLGDFGGRQLLRRGPM